MKEDLTFLALPVQTTEGVESRHHGTTRRLEWCLWALGAVAVYLLFVWWLA